ncbi:GNAT family N-acetyltransferase [Kineococcus rubinsiae]|uniref:GNAT family N-acetyltransferase n=1 Tax=Kineococcus rubinsiae TaxID=2609562 RepID=UPI001AD8CDD7|nr:GNAT family N-acetyltransferase [Kineococcus rubinsiae]
MDVRVVAIDEAQWRAYRAIRLEMLADTPLAFGETLEHALALDDAEWRFRARRCATPGNAGWAAVGADGRWLGTMSAFVHPVEGPFLVSVFVAPGHRGRAAGVADALLDEALAWVGRQAEGGSVLLHVHEANERARGFYRRRGFAETGVRLPYSLDETTDEVEMRLTLPTVP